jgi:ATP-dependent helicase/nuclease subunit B
LSFRFVLGRAGSGKTRFCLEAVAAEIRGVADGPPLILLVPEQATLQTDRALVALPGVPGLARAEVLSFRRLAWRVLSQTGGGARRHIDEVGKTMALRVLLARRRGELQVFGSASARTGFLGRLAQTLTELRSYGIGRAELSRGYEALQALGRGETILAGKLHDLALISGDLENYLTGRWVDPDDYLSLLAIKLAGHPVGLSGARVWMDGFAGFTRQEMDVLRALIGAVAEVTVTLCLDPDGLDAPRDGSSTFHPTLRTYDALRTLVAETAGRAETIALRGRPRFRTAAALAHLEREYPNLPPAPYPPHATEGAEGLPRERIPFLVGDPSREIILVAAESRRAEVAAAAREMVRLARSEGYRWREMALVARTLDPYADLIQSTFSDSRIPYFVDRRRSVVYHPLVEFARSAVEVALSDWAVEPVFRLLKTDLWPLPREEVDLLENYVLAHGVRGQAWVDEKPWLWRSVFDLDETAPPDPAQDAVLQRIDATRRKVASLLGPFVAALEAPPGPRASRRLPPTMRELAAGLWDLLTATGVPATLERWRLQALAQGSPGQAQEHEQVMAGLVSLLDQMVENLGELVASAPEFSRILEAGLETLALGLVPPSLDQVTVGAIDRSRQPDIRAFFVLGLNDGVFPAGGAAEMVFGDRERTELADLGLELAPSSREKAFGEDYLVYIALTRSSERLWLSYALSGDDGKALSPSTVIPRLRAAFPNLPEIPAPLEPRAAEVAGEAEALSGVVRSLASQRPGRHLTRAASDDSSAWREVYNWLVSGTDRRERVAAALRSLTYSNRPTPLAASLAEALYGSPARVSVSRLENYAGCPFRHFATAGLALRPRSRRQLRAPEIGRFYHAVTSVFTRSMIADGLDLANLDPVTVAARLEQSVAEVTPRLQSEVLLSTARNRFLAEQLRRTAGRTVASLREHARRSLFRPEGAELRFTLDADKGFAGLTLRGVIDRLETARLGTTLYARVIDFKSGLRHYSLLGTYTGLDLQLPAYLLAAGRLAPGGPARIPAGGFFFPVADPLVRAEGPLSDETLARERAKVVRARGVVLADPEVLRLMDCELGRPASLPLFPFSLDSDGAPRSSPALLSADKMALLLDFTRAKIEDLARRTLAGQIEIHPSRRPDGSTTCRFCDHWAVCGFDPGAGDVYRRLPQLKDETVWELMSREVTQVRGGTREEN